MTLLSNRQTGAQSVSQEANARSPRMEQDGYAKLISVSKAESSNGFPHINLTFENNSGEIRSENYHFGYAQVPKVNELALFNAVDISKFSKKVKDTLAERDNVKPMSLTWFNILQGCGIEYRDRVVMYVDEQMNLAWRMLNALLGNTQEDGIQVDMPANCELDEQKNVTFTDFNVIAGIFAKSMENCIGRIVHLKFATNARKNGYKDLRRVDIVGDKLQDISIDTLEEAFVVKTTTAVAKAPSVEDLDVDTLTALLKKVKDEAQQNQGLPVETDEESELPFGK